MALGWLEIREHPEHQAYRAQMGCPLPMNRTFLPVVPEAQAQTVEEMEEQAPSTTLRSQQLVKQVRVLVEAQAVIMETAQVVVVVFSVLVITVVAEDLRPQQDNLEALDQMGRPVQPGAQEHTVQDITYLAELAETALPEVMAAVVAVEAVEPAVSNLALMTWAAPEVEAVPEARVVLEALAVLEAEVRSQFSFGTMVTEAL